MHVRAPISLVASGPFLIAGRRSSGAARSASAPPCMALMHGARGAGAAARVYDLAAQAERVEQRQRGAGGCAGVHGDSAGAGGPRGGALVGQLHAAAAGAARPRVACVAHPLHRAGAVFWRTKNSLFFVECAVDGGVVAGVLARVAENWRAMAALLHTHRLRAPGRLFCTLLPDACTDARESEQHAQSHAPQAVAELHPDARLLPSRSRGRLRAHAYVDAYAKQPLQLPLFPTSLQHTEQCATRRLALVRVALRGRACMRAGGAPG